ncbi:MAG: SpoIIIAH-like family protein [Ruminococcaceae bacterium]|nr:SpoIIIAH-like family protein [Oscillospiraceae bacterium]
MKKFFEKKQWLTVSLVAALGLAVYLNYYFTQEPILSAGDVTSGLPAGGEADSLPVGGTVSDVPKEPVTPPEEEGYFAAARASRATAREEAVRLLDEVLASATAGEKEKAEATKQVSAIAANILKESNTENLILAKGFAQCVVFIDGENCSVVVESDALQPQETAQILELVQSQTGVAAKNIKISTPKT